jgi:hypothetical protein
MVWRAIPTERPPLVDEVIANFCGWRVQRGSCDIKNNFHKILSSWIFILKSDVSFFFFF